MGLIYKATNKLNNKSYIGQTIKTLEERQKEHFYMAFNKNKDTYFYKALRKYGKENFEWEILENNILKEQLNEKEKFWINYYDTFNQGYNLTQGGDSTDNLEKWRKENPELAKESAKLGYKKMKDILKNNPELEQRRKEKATEGMKRYIEEHKKEWKENSYNTYLKHKEQQDNQMKQFHIQQSKKVLCVETGITYPSASEAARQTKISQSNISSCCRGERLSAGKGKNKEKLHWKYIDEDKLL